MHVLLGGYRIKTLPSRLDRRDLARLAAAVRITVEDGITITAPRKTSRDIKRHKASNYGPAS